MVCVELQTTGLKATYENRKQLVNIDGRASELLDVTRSS